MKVFAIMAAAAACFSAFGADENTREVLVSKHGAWEAKATVDTFDDSEIAWTAYHKQGDFGGVAVACLVDQLH